MTSPPTPMGPVPPGFGSAGLAGVFANALVAGDSEQAAALLAQSGSLTEVTLDCLVVPALQLIGAGSAAGWIPLDTLYLSARMCRQLVVHATEPGQLLRPDQPRTAIGVLEDSHLLGSQIVQAVLRAAGYEATDWGARLTVADVANRAADEGVELVLVSVLMLRAALRVAQLAPALAAAGSDAVVVVGGAPFRFDPNLGAEVGVALVGREATDVLPILAAMRTGPRGIEHLVQALHDSTQERSAPGQAAAGPTRAGGSGDA